MRRRELERVGIQLPVLPTIVLGGLPGPADWAPRLEALGLDVVSSGAPVDTPTTWRTADAAVPHRPTKAVAGDAPALVAAGCRVLEASVEVDGAYSLRGADARITAVGPGDAGRHDPDDVAQRVLACLHDIAASGIWVAAGPGLDEVASTEAEDLLAAMVEGVRRVRLYLAKQQFD